MNLAKLLTICLLATISMTMAFNATAQFPGGMRGRNRSSAGSTDQSQRPAAAQESIADLVEYRLNLLQEDLKLTPAQEQPWAIFSDRVEALVTDISRERSRVPSLAEMNTERQMDHALDVARDRLTAFEDISTAAKTLYSFLTPQQKALTDAGIATIVPQLINGGNVGTPANAGFGRDTQTPP